MKKRILAMLLIAVMCVTAVGCTQTAAAPAATAAPAEQVQPVVNQTVASPSNPVASLAELQKAQPYTKLNDAPAGSTNVTYNWLTNIPIISQITFTYEGCDYTYRAAVSETEAAALDISGVSEQFPSINTMEIAKPNVMGGSYVLKYDSASGAGLASWYLPLTKCQYTLYTSNGCSGNMPLLAVMDAMYANMNEAKSAKGAVLDLGATTITISVENGGTSVLVLPQITLQGIAAGDNVEFKYFGDLNGSAILASITRLGAAQYKEVRGSVGPFDAGSVYVITSDNNVFGFVIDSSTKITGVADTIKFGYEVSVQYTGDLSDNPIAKTVEIIKVKVDPTPTPVPTAAPYVTRYAEGYVTSAAGIYVTVAGEMFTINSSNCYVSGYCYEGAYAYITYRDYGGGYHEVTEASFVDPVPVPDPYVSRVMAGYVDSVGGIYVSVNGVGFTVNGAYCVIDGTPTVGCYAVIYYDDYGGGYYDVTYACFEDDDDPIYYDWDESYYDEFTEEDLNDFADVLFSMYGVDIQG